MPQNPYPPSSPENPFPPGPGNPEPPQPAAIEAPAVTNLDDANKIISLLHEDERSQDVSLDLHYELSEVASTMLDMAIWQIVGSQPGDTSEARTAIKRDLYKKAYESVKARGGAVDRLPVPE